MKKWKQKHLYNYKYPHHFNWNKAIWILQKDDLVLLNGVEIHKVTDVKLLPIPGSLPEIIVKEEVINNDD
jgi:hypothetical protein